ncbi:MAG TPA: hypothetical protein VNL77_15370 [Roseiflexaceae bacterium]|nr:hypothetical protein [Roseiflexaceae bacterium]
MSDTDTITSPDLHRCLLALIGDRRAEFIRQALTYRSRASPGARRRLDQAIEHRIKGGRWNLKRPPDQQRIEQICAKLDESTPLLRALLLLWMESRPRLRLACKRQLDEHGIEEIDLARHDLACSEPWEQATLQRVTAGIAAAYQALATQAPDNHDVQLMLTCLTGRSGLSTDHTVLHSQQPAHRCTSASTAEDAPAPPRNVYAQEQQENTTSMWSIWLEQIRALPAHAPEWDETAVEGFLTAIRDVAAGKRAEREQGRELLRAALASLAVEASDELSYFGCDQVAGWSAEMVDTSRAEDLAAYVDRLRADLIRHRELSVQPRPTRIELARQWRAELDALEASISACISELSGAFTAAPEGGPSSGGSVAPAETAGEPEAEAAAHSELAPSPQPEGAQLDEERQPWEATGVTGTPEATTQNELASPPQPEGLQLRTQPPLSRLELWAHGIVGATPEYGIELHVAALAALGRTEEIRHRLWRAQARTLLPLIDHVRLQICEELTRTYGPDWPIRWRAPLSDEEEQAVRISPLACQWGHLEWLVKNCADLRAANRWRSLVSLCRWIRNEIAHYRPVGFGDFESLRREVERAMRKYAPV